MGIQETGKVKIPAYRAKRRRDRCGARAEKVGGEFQNTKPAPPLMTLVRQL